MAKAEAQERGISPESVARATFFKMVSDPNRLAILLTLAGCERPDGALAEELGMTPVPTSIHLRHLLHAGLVEARYEGHHRVYSLTPLGWALGKAVGRLAEPGGGP
jgi:DNA-binding transcriptional ArsR family regulator